MTDWEIFALVWYLLFALAGGALGASICREANRLNEKDQDNEDA